jgi:hypothetical protein
MRDFVYHTPNTGDVFVLYGVTNSPKPQPLQSPLVPRWPTDAAAHLLYLNRHYRFPDGVRPNQPADPEWILSLFGFLAGAIHPAWPWPHYARLSIPAI